MFKAGKKGTMFSSGYSSVFNEFGCLLILQY